MTRIYRTPKTITYGALPVRSGQDLNLGYRFSATPAPVDISAQWPLFNRWLGGALELFHARRKSLESIVA